MAAIPIWALFIGTMFVIVGVLEIGYQVGRRTHRRTPGVKESSVGAFAAAMLGLSAFILAFSFNIAAERYQTRKAKVRDQVNAIQVAYLRSDFLPEPDRTESKELLVRFVTEIAEAPPRTGKPAPDAVPRALALGNDVQRQLWNIAAVDGRRERESNTAALYVEAINRLLAIHAERAMLETPVVRNPIWLALYSLTCLATLGVAYQSGIAGSKRSKVGLFLAASFAVVMALIADLDRVGGVIRVPHEPFEDLQRSLTTPSRSAGD